MKENVLLQHVPVEVAKDPDMLSRMCHDADEPLCIEENGKDSLVVMSFELYRKTIARIAEVHSLAAETEKRSSVSRVTE